MAVFYEVDFYNGNTTMGADYLASVLFNLVLQITKGPAYTVTRTTVDDKRFETERPLQERFGRTRRQTMISILTRIVLQTFGENTFIEQLTEWEFDISEYERVTQEKRPDVLKTTLLMIPLFVHTD